MKKREPIGDPLLDPNIVDYRALLERQNARLRAELAHVKASQLTRSGRWIRNLLFGAVILALGIVTVGALLFMS